MGPRLGLDPFLRKLHADGGYQGPEFQRGLSEVCGQVSVEIVSSDAARGFVVIPQRWIVERTIAWLNRCRRLAKKWECLNRSGLAFLRWASVRPMVGKLCQQCTCSRMDTKFHKDSGQQAYCPTLRACLIVRRCIGGGGRRAAGDGQLAMLTPSSAAAELCSRLRVRRCQRLASVPNVASMRQRSGNGLKPVSFRSRVVTCTSTPYSAATISRRLAVNVL